MTDIHTKEIRSKNMAAIRSLNTKPEVIVFRELKKRKINFKKHYSFSKISIDIAQPRKKNAVFIDGDFWHGYQFNKLKKRLPKKYWLSKIEKNIKRDKKRRDWLKKNGWQILNFWEHEIKKNLNSSVKKIIKFLK